MQLRTSAFAATAMMVMAVALSTQPATASQSAGSSGPAIPRHAKHTKLVARSPGLDVISGLDLDVPDLTQRFVEVLHDNHRSHASGPETVEEQEDEKRKEKKEERERRREEERRRRAMQLQLQRQEQVLQQQSPYAPPSSYPQAQPYPSLDLAAGVAYPAVSPPPSPRSYQPSTESIYSSPSSTNRLIRRSFDKDDGSNQSDSSHFCDSWKDHDKVYQLCTKYVQKLGGSFSSKFQRVTSQDGSSRFSQSRYSESSSSTTTTTKTTTSGTRHRHQNQGKGKGAGTSSSCSLKQSASTAVASKNTSENASKPVVKVAPHSAPKPAPKGTSKPPAVSTPQRPQGASAASTGNATSDGSSSTGSGSGSNGSNGSGDDSNSIYDSETIEDGSSGNSSGADELNKNMLTWHNAKRKLHHAPSLSYDAEMHAKAASWAAQCQWAHNAKGFGQNLAMGTGNSDGRYAINMWYDEVKQYNFSSGGFSSATGHFTQMVWKASKGLGCAMASCDAAKMGLGGSGKANYVVCNYTPAGNAAGQFLQNVLAA